MKKVFITGISSGIGKASAEAFLNRGDIVIGTVRDENDVLDLKAKYPINLKILKIDLIGFQPSDVIDFLSKEKITTIDLLINNAGIALAAPFAYQDFSEVEKTIALNVLSTMKLTQILIPFLQKTKGRIINITSVAGQKGTPFLAAYAASKHAIEGFSESLRRELNIWGIEVVIIGPGSIKTPIWTKGFEIMKDRYSETPYAKSFAKFIRFAANEKERALDPQVVVENIFHASFSKKPCVRYAPVPNRFQYYLEKLFPKRFADQAYIKGLKLTKLTD